MGYFVSRQRDFKDSCLYVEICCTGPKNAGPDLLTARYEGEQKNLVDPRDAVSIADKIFRRWDRDYADETKRLRIVGLTVPLFYDFTTKGIAAAKTWADRVFASMAKCGSCSRPMGTKEAYEHENLANVVFCSEVCLANRYRVVFGVEAPQVSGKKLKATK